MGVKTIDPVLHSFAYGLDWECPASQGRLRALPRS